MRPRLFTNLASMLDDMRAARPLLVLFVISFAVVLWLQPLKAGLALWGVSKVALSAYLGIVIDRVGFNPAARPYLQTDAIRQAGAWLRRALIVAAAIIAGGMLP